MPFLKQRLGLFNSPGLSEAAAQRVAFKMKRLPATNESATHVRSRCFADFLSNLRSPKSSATLQVPK